MPDINQKQRASRAWPILVALARNRETITYGEIADSLGIHHRPVRYVLSEIQDYCLEEKLPPLTILVANQRGSVGSGFIAWDVDDIATGLERVYSYPWDTIPNPFSFASDGESLESIADDVVAKRTTPRQAYSRVQVRGMAQQVFRRILLFTYGGRCAVSEFNEPQLLEAAHILPWRESNQDQRLDPRNGILLSVIHHRFFDLGWMVLNPDYTISAKVTDLRSRSMAREMLEQLDGASIALPANEEHWPDPTLIERRYAAQT